MYSRVGSVAQRGTQAHGRHSQGLTAGPTVSQGTGCWERATGKTILGLNFFSFHFKVGGVEITRWVIKYPGQRNYRPQFFYPYIQVTKSNV